MSLTYIVIEKFHLKKLPAVKPGDVSSLGERNYDILTLSERIRSEEQKIRYV
jgi:hypothetical protein